MSNTFENRFITEWTDEKTKIKSLILKDFEWKTMRKKSNEKTTDLGQLIKTTTNIDQTFIFSIQKETLIKQINLNEKFTLY